MKLPKTLLSLSNTVTFFLLFCVTISVFTFNFPKLANKKIQPNLAYG
jgi:hypothetical protein